LHRIESMNFNASQGYSIAKELKQIRTQRREVKNQISAFTSFRDTFYKHNRQLGVNLFTTTKKMKESGGWEPSV